MNSPKTLAMAIKRRDFFKMGGISLGAISPLGLSLPEVLANEAASGGKKQINVIFMFLQGGASHLDMYDLKPDAPQEIRGNYNPARTNVPGLHLSDQLPKLGKCADKFSLIRSMHSFCSKPARQEPAGPRHRGRAEYAATTAGARAALCPLGGHETSRP